MTLRADCITIGPGGNIVGEASMEKINYAASSAYFVSRIHLLRFPKAPGSRLRKARPDHLLAAAIERLVGLEGPPLSDDEVLRSLAKERGAAEKEFEEILQGLKLAADSKNQSCRSDGQNEGRAARQLAESRLAETRRRASADIILKASPSA